MKLLEAEPALAPAPEAPPAGAAPGPEPSAPARACPSCGAAMEAEQDWCLTCGSAAPGRLGGRPGWRPAFTIAAITLLVLAGAVVAAYAAMSGDAAREASGPVADAGAPVVPPAPVTPAAEQPPIPASKLPKVSTGGSKGTATSPVTPVDTTPSPTTTPSGDTTPSDTKPDTTKDAPAAPPAPAQIDLASDAGARYDPLDQAVGPGDVRRAIDGNPATSWAVGSRNLEVPGVGYVLDVGKKRGIRVLELTTSTPGFKVEVYATDEATIPPQITDTRWAHIRDKSKVARTQRIVLGGGSSEYRHVLLWFTEPPADGTRIRLAELRLLG